MVNCVRITAHFSSLQTWHASVVESRNLKIIEQEGIFISIHDKLTDLQTNLKKKENVSSAIEDLHLYSTDIRF